MSLMSLRRKAVATATVTERSVSLRLPLTRDQQKGGLHGRINFVGR